MALPWGLETTKKETGKVLPWEEGIKPPTTIEIAERIGYPILEAAPPKEEIKDTWLKRVARVILPRSLEIKWGITEPNEWDLTMEAEDTRLSLLREKQFTDLYKKEITEAPEIPKDYKEPTGYWGQLLEGLKSGYISSVKGGFGYFAESMGRQLGSPEMIEWGSNLGDKATIELIKKPELLEPEDLKPFFEGGLIDRKWWGRRMGQAIPFMGTTIATATFGGLVGGPAGATVGGYTSVFILEKGNSYKRYLDEGVPPDKADTYSTAYAVPAAIIENAFGISPARIGTQIATKGAQRVVYNSYKSFLLKEIPKIGIKTLKMAMAEGGEEVAQSITENLVLKFYKTETPVFSKDLAEEFASGFAAALPFGAVNIRIPDVRVTTPKEIKTIEQSIKKADEVLRKVEKPLPKIETKKFPENTYKRELLEEIGKLEELPVIEPNAFDWTPPKLTYNNPYTKVMYKIWNRAGRIWDTKGPLILKESQTKEISDLLKERQRVYDGLVKKYYEETIKPITKLTTEEKQKVGEMVFKRIEVPEDYEITIKDIDTKIGQLGQEIVNLDKGLIRQGFLASPETGKRAKEIGQRLITLRKELRDALGKLRISMRANRQVLSLINQVENQMSSLEATFGDEFTAFMREGEIVEKVIPERRIIKGVGKLPENLKIIGDEVRKFKTFKEMMKSDTGIELEKLYEQGILERAGFKDATFIKGEKEITTTGLKQFFNFVKKPYKFKPEKQVQQELKGNIDKLIKTTKTRERLALQREILKDIDIISVADSLRFLESVINDLREERGSLWLELKELRKELEKPLPLLTEETWLSHLGEYARTLYVKTDPRTGESKVTPHSTLTKEGVIDRSTFKRKLLDEEWGANVLTFEGKTLAEVKEYSLEELKAIGVEAKEKYGWTFQADYILARTFKDLSRAYASRLFQKAIVENPRLFTNKVKEADEKGFIPVRDILPKGVEKDVRLGPLNFGYIHPGLEAELKTFILGAGRDSIMDIFQEPLSWWKAFKVAGNPPTVIRNWLSGMLFQTDLAGYPVWDPRNTPKYLQAVKAYAVKDDLYKRLRNAGQYGTDYFSIEIAADEMTRIIAKAEKSKNPMASYSEGLLSALGTKLQDTKQLFSYYGHIDHVQRTYLSLCATKDGASMPQAVHFSNKWELDYRFVPNFVESLRSGLPGWLYPFLSFYTLMAPRIAEVLVTRPWVLLKYPIIIGVTNAISASLLGADDDEIENAKPEWLKDKDYVILLPVRDNQGDFQFLDMDYTLPFGGPQSLFMDWDQVLMMLKNPGMMSIVTSMLNNYDNFTDRKIYNETDLPEDKRKKIAEYVARNLGPGFVTHALNIYRASKGEIIGFPLKKERDLAQTVARTLGISTYSGGFNEAFGKIRNIQREISDIQWTIRILMSNPNISIEEKQRKMIEYQDEIKRRTEKIQEISRAMPSPVLPEKEAGKEPRKAVPWGE